MRARSFVSPILLAALISGCVSHPRPNPALTRPVTIAGDFVDYGIRYAITASLWFQRRRARYHIVKVDTTAGSLIAHRLQRASILAHETGPAGS